MNTVIFLEQEAYIQAGISSDSVIYIGIICVLLCVSAMMSGSESAFFTLGPKELDNLKEDESSSAKLIQKLLDNPRDLLATILITNNMVNVGVVILSSFVLNEIFPVESETNALFRFFLDRSR